MTGPTTFTVTGFGDPIFHPTAAELVQLSKGGGLPLHIGLPEDQSAMLPFQAQVRRPDPTIWWPEGQWNMSTVPKEVPSPRTTCTVPQGGGWS